MHRIKGIVYVTETDYDWVHARQNTPRNVYIKRVRTLDTRRAAEGASRVELAYFWQINYFYCAKPLACLIFNEFLR
jgi:hypothetical protein